MLTAASCLSENHTVSVLWDDVSLKEGAQKKFGIDLSRVAFSNNIFSSSYSLVKRIRESSHYDAIFYLSDGSLPVVATKLYLHFQFPTEWIQGKSFKNKLKMRRVSAVICNSLFTKTYIDRTFHVQSLILYPPASEQAKIKIEKANCILTVGRFAELGEGRTFKKQEVMIALFKEMIDAGLKNWAFILVISFKPEEQEKISFLKKQIVGYPIKIVENAIHDELMRLYAQSKIYWHAAGFGEDVQKHPELVEHFGISTVQAMEQGAVPVVVNLGGQKEIVEDNKNGLLWNTTKECLEKTEMLIRNEDLLQTFSKAAQDRAQAFSIKAFCHSLGKIIV